MKKWLFRECPSGLPQKSWGEELSISPLLLKLLWNRGLTSKEDMEQFLSAPLRSLTNPSKWPMLPEAAKLLSEHLLSGKKLAVWGDYDVDGITSTALVLDVLEFHGFSPLHHLPDRIGEGYGLNIEHLELLAKQGCEILLTVDCGISDVAAIDRANELGMTVIVSDHHLPPECLPQAAAFVNPRMNAASKWPCIHLAGVGVAFYLMAAVNSLLASHTGRRYRMSDALDLAALGTLADVMSLEGENRILVRAGLDRMTTPARPGMAALKAVSGFDISASLDSIQTVFRLAPRLNAAGRMGNPQLALDLLRSNNYQEATRLAEDIDACNQQRRTEEDRAFKEALVQAADMLEIYDYSALALFGEDWHPGVVGIVASRIVEKFNRPTVVLYGDNKIIKGSGRTASDFDLYSGLESISHLLLGFGGHKQAAGLSLEKDRLEDFRKAFSDIARKDIGDAPPSPPIMLEGELPFKYASNQIFLEELKMLQPCGPGNPEPVFASLPLTVKKRSYLGHTFEHIRLDLEEEGSGIILSAKAWRMAAEFPESLVGEKIRIAYTPKIDIYNGIPNVDLSIKDWMKI